MIALLLGGASAIGLLVWHMQRRARAPVVLSFARLLPEPKPAARPEPRFAPTLPLTSIGFWLRIAAALGALTKLSATDAVAVVKKAITGADLELVTERLRVAANGPSVTQPTNSLTLRFTANTWVALFGPVTLKWPRRPIPSTINLKQLRLQI